MASISAPVVIDEHPQYRHGHGLCGECGLLKFPKNNADYPGRVLIIYSKDNSASGLVADRNEQLWMLTSDDNDATLSAPRLIVDCLMLPQAVGLPTDNIGFKVVVGSNLIRIPNGAHAGRIVCALQAAYRYKSFHGSLYSDDAGDTWHYGVFSDFGAMLGAALSEPAAALTTDGRLVMTVRCDTTGIDKRAIAYSADGGIS